MPQIWLTRIRLICLVWVLCSTAMPLNAGGIDSQFFVRLWGADDGMPASSVTGIAQTPEGYIWVGTLFRGVLRFDGHRFESFNPANTPALRNVAAIRKLLTDSGGRLWINTFGDSLLFWDEHGFHPTVASNLVVERLLWSDRSRVVFLGTDNELIVGEMRNNDWLWQRVPLPAGKIPPQICADGEGVIWFLRSESELCCYQNGQLTTLSPVAGLQGQSLQALAADSLGRIWVGTSQSLARWETNQFIEIAPNEQPGSLDVAQIIPSGNGDLWVKTSDRLRRMSADQWVAESPHWIEVMQSTTAGVSFIMPDRHGGFWTGVEHSGLLHVAPDGELSRLTTATGLPSDSLRFAFLDRENNVWTGYERGNLVQIRRRLFRSIGRQQGMTESLVTTVCETPSGEMWLGTHWGKVIRIRDGKFDDLVLPNSSQIYVSTAAIDARGRAWVGDSVNGLMVQEKDLRRVVAGRDQLHGYVRLMLPSRDGRLWIATQSRLWAVKDDTLTLLFPPESSDPSYEFSALAEGADGTLWVGTFTGELLHFNTNATLVETILPPGRESLGRLWTLHPAPDGGIWIGTSDGGLLRYREGKFTRYTSTEGLPSDYITQVLGDQRGNLWLVTGAGIARLTSENLHRFDQGEIPLLPVNLYGKADGLSTIGSSVEFQPNCWRAKDGSLWFALTDGVAWVNPDEVPDNLVPPGVALEEVRANDQRVWPANRSAVQTTVESSARPLDTLDTPPLRLGPGRQDLEFKFAGLSFATVQGARVSYKLDGIDQHWTDSMTASHASYRRVEPGKYRFQVRACNRDGIWSVGAAELGIIVVPHFWEMLWFRLLMAVLLVFAAILAVVLPLRVRQRRRLARVKQLHALEQERSRIAHDLHDDLGASLAQIALMSSMAQNPSITPTRMREHLDGIAGKSRAMVSALDEIVWAVNPRHDSSTSLNSYLSEYAEEFLRVSMISCRLDVPSNQPVHPLSSHLRYQLFLSFKEALTNIVRHSAATEVWIRIHSDTDSLTVTVEDNGSGLPHHEAGSGADGLMNMSERLEKIGGRCDVKDRPGGGTSVRFWLPTHPKRFPQKP